MQRATLYAGRKAYVEALLLSAQNLSSCMIFTDAHKLSLHKERKQRSWRGNIHPKTMQICNKTQNRMEREHKVGEGLVSLGCKYRTLGWKNYDFTSRSLVSGRRSLWSWGVFICPFLLHGLSSEYSFMCPDYRRSHLHGRLDLLHGLPHPPETPSIQNIVIVLPLLLY